MKQGKKKLQLSVGSMSVQVFKSGAVVETILFQSMASWAQEGKKDDTLAIASADGKQTWKCLLRELACPPNPSLCPVVGSISDI